MKTIKVIDLLNKIANGEEIPKKIKIYGSILRLNENKDNYLYEDSDEYYGDEFIHWFKLNDEVEIIEEPQEHKIPEKLGLTAYIDGEIAYSWSKSETILKTKINEILDYLEEIE